MSKTPEYTRKAVKKYSEKFDQTSLLLPKGTKEVVKKLGSLEGKSLNGYVCDLISQDMKKRRKEIMSIVIERIQKDLDTCKTLEDWSKAYNRLLEDFRDTVNGERKFEAYISEVLGAEALQKFVSDIREPLYPEKTVRLMEARADFGFENADSSNDEAVQIPKDEEYIWCRAYYSYLSHLFLAATSRCNKIEENITRVLGREAFERLVSQGSYEKDKLWTTIANTLPDGAEKSSLFVQYMTNTGMFEGQKEVKPLTLGEEWKEVKEGLPEETGMYLVLLQDMSVMPALFEKKMKAWVKSHLEWSELVIAWKEMENK